MCKIKLRGSLIKFLRKIILLFQTIGKKILFYFIEIIDWNDKTK